MTDNTTILIIDDKTANIFSLAALLQKPERTILSATSGKEGLKIALGQNIDLIIIDVQMPDMDGFEVAQILQSNKRTKETPIIFASASEKEKHSVMKGFEEGAVDYLYKPLDPEITKAKVSVLLKIQLQKRELIEKNKSLEEADNKIKALNEDMQRNLQRMEAVNKELESFSYSVSHDLRSPLRSIISYSQALIEDFSETLQPEAQKMLQTVMKNGTRMNLLIDDLLEFSRLIKTELNKSEADMDKLVQHVLAEMNVSKVNIKKDNLIAAMADQPLMTQVWTNLISNAIKYSARNPNPEVQIGSYIKQNEIIYFVKDNGVGFDMQYANKLFNVFQRLHKASDFEGTGVGLALVARIINRHGGRVWADGKVNEGASFYFSLPLITNSFTSS